MPRPALVPALLLRSALAACLLGAVLPAAAQGTPWLAKERFAAAVKFTGLTYHPDGGENEERYKRSLDSRDFFR